MKCCDFNCRQGRDCPNRTPIQAFNLFWNIKMPAAITRLSASMTCRKKQDAALYVASVLALIVVAFNV